MSYLDDIGGIVEDVAFGNVMVTLKRHNNSTQQLIIHSYQVKKYKNSNEAASDLLHILKAAKESNFSGTLSFTVAIKDGTVTRLIKQENQQVDYNK